MLSAIVFILVLSVLVVVHEWGHFIMARACGIKVERFSIGFGPVLLKVKPGPTEYCFSLLPLGGYVKLAGESPEDATGAPDEFNSKAAWQKFLVVAAGPLMNAFLAFLLFAGVFLIGEPKLTTKIGKVMEASPAKLAGLQKDDQIISINEKPVTYWEDLVTEIRKTDGTIALSVKRGEELMRVRLSPGKQSGLDLNSGKKTKISFIGVMPAMEMTHIKHSLAEALSLGAAKVVTLTGMIFRSFGLMFTGAVSFKESMSGPIGIFIMTKEAAALGVSYLLYFMGQLSVSLFVLNLLPIPVLDGGHILFLVIEKIKGSPLKDSIKEKMTQAGVVFFLLLMSVVIVQDISRFSIIDKVRNMFATQAASGSSSQS